MKYNIDNISSIRVLVDNACTKSSILKILQHFDSNITSEDVDIVFCDINVFYCHPFDESDNLIYFIAPDIMSPASMCVGYADCFYNYFLSRLDKRKKALKDIKDGILK